MPQEAVNGDPVFPYLDMDDSIIELSITRIVRMHCQCVA